MPRLALDAKTVLKLVPGDYADAIVPGLTLRVSPAARSWGLRYTFAGRRRRCDLGPVAVLGLADARQFAKDLLAEALHGKDPRVLRDELRRLDEERRRENEEKRRAAERVVTVRKISEEWLRSKDAQRWRPRTKVEFARIVAKRILPDFGDRDATMLERGEVRRALALIAETAPVEANRTFAIFRRLYTWALEDSQEWLRVKGSPLAGLKRKDVGGRETPRSTTYSDAELGAIFAAVAGTELRDLVPFVAHTAVRSAEARSARWADLDETRKLWTVPPELHKTGEATGLPHRVPLSDGALAILKGIRSRRVATLSPYVFAAPTKDGFMDQPNKAVATASKVAGVRVRLHDLRRTASERIADRFGRDVAHDLLGHSRGPLDLAYIPQRPLRAVQEAVVWWAAELARILGESAPKREARA